jgi:hypothetical protein
MKPSFLPILTFLALASCTSSDIEDLPQPTASSSSAGNAAATLPWCVYPPSASNPAGLCFPGSFTECPSGGIPALNCPYSSSSAGSGLSGSSSSAGSDSANSGDSSSSNEVLQEYAWCVFGQDQNCLPGPTSTCPPGGTPANVCPYLLSSSSSSSNGGLSLSSSSSSLPAVMSSSSVGGGVSSSSISSSGNNNGDLTLTISTLNDFGRTNEVSVSNGDCVSIIINWNEYFYPEIFIQCDGTNTAGGYQTNYIMTGTVNDCSGNGYYFQCRIGNISGSGINNNWRVCLTSNGTTPFKCSLQHN